MTCFRIARRAASAALLAACAATVPAAAQRPGGIPAPDTTVGPPRRGWVFGITGLTGATYNPTGVEAGLVWALGSATARNVYVAVHFGGYTSETGGLTGGTRGWFLGPVVGYRQNLVTLLSLGSNERDLDFALLTGQLEFSANLDHDAPTPDAAHGTAAFLLGFSYSDGNAVDEAFALLLGPALFIGGQSTDLRMQVSLRFQSPLGRH